MRLGLQVCCGSPGVKDKFIRITLHSEAALKEFEMISACPPNEAGKFALKLLSIFFHLKNLRVPTCVFQLHQGRRERSPRSQSHNGNKV